MSAALASLLQARVEAAVGLLRHVAARHAPVVLASSFGAEDMVLIDLIARHALPIAVFTLDTGRLPEETHALIERTRERYGIDVAIYAPEAAVVEAYTRVHGSNAFYRSVTLRQQCCATRKIAPLARALAGRGAWITGLRRSQSVTRADIDVETFDTAHGLAKFNPLADWSDDDVWDHLRAFDVPVNALHAQGYTSIGCAPCTRAVLPGEDVRAGRWWWEQPEHKECGLHRRPAQSIELAVKVIA
jgi:phosphoadenosine phosphosulfate reductase